MKITKIFLLLLLALMAFTSGCSSRLIFETIAGVPLGDSLGGSYPGEKARIYVISSNETLPAEALNWVTVYDQETILNVDYSKYFVVVGFNGWRVVIYSVYYGKKSCSVATQSQYLLILMTDPKSLVTLHLEQRTRNIRL